MDEKDIALTIHFSEEVLMRCKRSVLEVLARCTNEEIRIIRGALAVGCVNGCSSIGERRCFFGTLARLRGEDLAFCKKRLGLSTEAIADVEYFFFQICSSSENILQTTENNPFALLASLWCREVLQEERDVQFETKITATLFMWMRRWTNNNHALTPIP